MSSQWGLQKLLQGLSSHELKVFLSVFNLFLTQWIMAILSKGCKPDKLESQNFLKLSFMNICGLHSNFVKTGSSVESKSPVILTLCETNLDDSIDSGNFSVTDYLPLIWKDSITHMHVLAVYVKEGLPFVQDLSLEKLYRFLLLFLTGFTTLIVLLLFLQSITFFSFMHGFWYKDFNIDHKNWLTYSGGTDRAGKLCYNLEWPYSDG